MNHDYLVRMGNQIADALAANSNAEQAVGEIADHLTRFWDPRMRTALLQAAGDADAATRLSPLLLQSLARLAPQTQA